MNVLLLGGFGYIGSTLTSYLLENTEHKITIVDTLELGVNPFFFYYVLNHERVRFIKADITDMRILYPLIRKNDVVVDLAAKTLPASAKDPDDAIMINQTMAEIVGDCCNKLDTKLIFLSTCSNYGKSETLVNEESELFPVSIYAISKVNAEKYLKKHVHDVVILRCATAYGLGAGRTREDVLLNEFVFTAHKTGKIEVFQPGAHRPICHVEDISKAIKLVIDKMQNGELKGTNVYNIGSNEENYTKGELAQIIAGATGAEIKLVELADARDYQVDFTKAKNELGFTPDRSAPETIIEIFNVLKGGDK